MPWHSALLPVPPSSIVVGFTTDRNRLPAHPRITSAQISEDPSLGVHKTSHPDVPIKGGFGLYLAGPKAFASALSEHAREVVIGYEVFFEAGFEWAKGGKLPGLCTYGLCAINRL